jgi:hypothetical protein
MRTFDHPEFAWRKRHHHMYLPMHDANRWGGRSAMLRQLKTPDQKRSSSRWKSDIDVLQYNVDVWCAQQTLRKKWKARDYEVVELPFQLAPKLLRRVVPELHTELPQMADPKNGDYQNIRAKVFDREAHEMQRALFGGATAAAADIAAQQQPVPASAAAPPAPVNVPLPYPLPLDRTGGARATSRVPPLTSFLTF